MAAIDQAVSLTDRDRKLINGALASLSKAVLEIDRAEQAGRDVKEYRDRLADIRHKLLTLKRAYWPAGD